MIVSLILKKQLKSTLIGRAEEKSNIIIISRNPVYVNTATVFICPVLSHKKYRM